MLLATIMLTLISQSAWTMEPATKYNVEIAVYHSEVPGIAATPDAKRWIQQKPVISQVISLTAPNDIRVVTKDGNKIFDFNLGIEEAHPILKVTHGSVSISGGGASFTFKDLVLNPNEWRPAAARVDIDGGHQASTLIIVRYITKPHGE